LSKWSEWKKNVGDTRPWHLLNPDRLLDNQDIVNKRLELCKACPELIASTSQCKKCGCFMNLKTKLAEAECPIGKWHREN
jgi:hypothetical protein